MTRRPVWLSPRPWAEAIARSVDGAVAARVSLVCSAMTAALPACVSHRANCPGQTSDCGAPSDSAGRSSGEALPHPGPGAGLHWVGTWASGPQLVEDGNLPPAPGLANRTLRQVIRTSIGGSSLRLRLSNAYGDGPVTMTSVHLAASGAASAINPATDRALTFAGSASVTIEPGDAVWSDPIAYPIASLSSLTVSIAFGRVPAAVTGHPGSRTTSYLVDGNAVAETSLPAALPITHWYYLTGIDVAAEGTSAAVVALGDSITDGRGSTTDGNDRWTDDLSQRLQRQPATIHVGVLNLGIGGNALLRGGLGPPALQRFASDVLNQSGARWVVMFEGVNDIGASTTQDVANQLVSAFGHLIDLAHQHGMRAYGATIAPFGASGYASTEHEKSRQAVNRWIRTGGLFDAVIDFDAVVRDPRVPTNLLQAYDSGDGLHLNPAGYRALADAIDLDLFTR